MIVPVLPSDESWWRLERAEEQRDHAGCVSPLYAHPLPPETAPPRRPIGFRKPAPKSPEPGPALPDWLLT